MPASFSHLLAAGAPGAYIRFADTRTEDPPVKPFLPILRFGAALFAIGLLANILSAALSGLP